MKISEAAWIAGFIDGEGHLGFTSRKGGGKALTLRVTQTCREPLEFMVEKLGAGRVYGPYEPRGIGTKPRYVYTVAVQLDVIRVLKLLMPYLRVKRSDAERLLEHARLHPPREDRHQDCTHERTREAMKTCSRRALRQARRLV